MTWTHDYAKDITYNRILGTIEAMRDERAALPSGSDQAKQLSAFIDDLNQTIRWLVERNETRTLMVEARNVVAARTARLRFHGADVDDDAQTLDRLEKLLQGDWR